MGMRSPYLRAAPASPAAVGRKLRALAAHRTLVAVLVPVKSFATAKVRLAPALAPAERAALARSMAANVVAAARPLPVSVVCDDEDVAAWAETAGAAVLWCPGLGLNGAVSHGVSALGAAGASAVIVAHADLPLADDLAPVAGDDPDRQVTLVPDRRDDGTNVLCVPAGSGFSFAYGPRSFARHQAEAARLGLPWRVLHDARLGWDVDVPDDLAYRSPCA
jgi:2-phospho-L-lactate guanylyltransferase